MVEIRCLLNSRIINVISRSACSIIFPPQKSLWPLLRSQRKGGHGYSCPSCGTRTGAWLKRRSSLAYFSGVRFCRGHQIRRPCGVMFSVFWPRCSAGPFPWLWRKLRGVHMWTDFSLISKWYFPPSDGVACSNLAYPCNPTWSLHGFSPKTGAT